MIIDIHTHIFPDQMAAKVLDKLSRLSRSIAFTDGTLDGLRRSMDRAEVDRSIVLPVATNAHQVEKINDVSARINESFDRTGIFSFGCMHPEFTNYVDELNRIGRLGLRGIKLHPIYQETDLDDIKYLRIFDRAAELGLVVIIHAGLDIGFPGVVRCSPSTIKRVVERIGNFKLIAAHMGSWKNWDEVLEMLVGTEIMIDTAFSTGEIVPRADCVWNESELKMLNADQFMRFVKAFGAEKILFGTDSPWSDQKISIEFINRLPIDERDREKILGGNAQKLLGLDR